MFNPDGSFWGVFEWLGAATCIGRATFEDAWRCQNIDDEENLLAFDRWWDAPPDLYRYEHSNPRKHTSKLVKKGYYQAIKNNVTNDQIFNFYNERDAALDGWNLGQITKPDWNQNPAEWPWPQWQLSDVWDHDPIPVESDACNKILGNREDCEVNDYYSSPIVGDANPDNMSYDLSWDNIHHRRAILAHILPSRTYALGATADLAQKGEILRDFDLRGVLKYTNSDYDHSAQWLQSYTERRVYWSRVVDDFGLRE